MLKISIDVILNKFINDIFDIMIKRIGLIVVWMCGVMVVYVRKIRKFKLEEVCFMKLSILVIN